jgi:hypothetical protein
VELVRDDEFVPYSNQASVARPLGFTLPLRVAPEEVIELAAKVDTVGGSRILVVVKLLIVPFDSPSLLLAATRK